MTDLQQFGVFPMRSKDVELVKELERDFNLGGWSKEDYLSEINRKDSICLVVRRTAKAEGKVVGYLICRVIIDGGTFRNEVETEQTDAFTEIYNLAIDKSFRKLGLGKMLIERMLEISKPYGVDAVWLEVRASNLDAIGFYSKQMFERIYVRKRFYSNPVEDAFVMKRRVYG